MTRNGILYFRPLLYIIGAPHGVIWRVSCGSSFRCISSSGTYCYVISTGSHIIQAAIRRQETTLYGTIAPSICYLVTHHCRIVAFWFYDHDCNTVVLPFTKNAKLISSRFQMNNTFDEVFKNNKNVSILTLRTKISLSPEPVLDSPA